MPQVAAVGVAMFGAGTVGAAVVTGIIVGAIIGAATAIVTGGNILEGALMGAALGGIGGGIAFGLSGAGAAAVAPGAGAGTGASAGAGAGAGIAPAGTMTGGQVAAAGGITQPALHAAVGGVAAPVVAPAVAAPAGTGLLSNEVWAGVGQGLFKGAGEFLGAKEKAEADKEIAEYEASQRISTPADFGRRTANITPPASWSAGNWWDEHLHPESYKQKQGLLS